MMATNSRCQFDVLPSTVCGGAHVGMRSCVDVFRFRLTQRGREIRNIVSELFARHAEGLQTKAVISIDGMDEITSALRRVERYWTDQIRYIY